MAQSAVTVTPNNPTPPTNFGTGYVNAGKFTPGPPTADYAGTVYNDPWHPGMPNPTGPTPANATTSTLPAYLDDATAGTNTVFAAPASGTAAEGAGTEVVVTAPGSVAAAPTQSFSDLGNYTTVPNSQHASSLSPAAGTTLTSLGTPSSVSGASGTYSQTVTGTGFTKQSVIYVNGVAQTTTFNSTTSLTAAAVTKKTSPGTWPVTVVTAGAVTTAAVNWTFT